MPVTQHSSLRPGSLVSIVLKADQRTGRQVEGTVSQLLTRHNHPRGIKVKLTDGRVGRVEKILNQTGQQSRYRTSAMNQNNPWADEQSQGYPYQGNDGNTQEQSHQGYQHYPQQQQSQFTQQQQHQHFGAATGYSGSRPQNEYQPSQQPPVREQRLAQQDTESFLASQQDRGEQFERMQQFESNAPVTEDDKNQAQLQKEYPNIDSSLIAAIYHERKPNMAEVRELLQELNG